MSRRPRPARRIIETEADIAGAIRSLRRKCAHMRSMHDLAGDPPLRRRVPGFEGLARIIVGQQLSVASAAAIWNRFAALVDPMEAAGVLEQSEDALRGVGLSRPKIKTLRASSEAVAQGLDLAGLAQASDEDVRIALTTVTGIGPWTSDIFAMFCLGRADAFAPGDLALQIAVQMGMNLEARPTADQLTEIAERWRPWRSVAALVLWQYYKVAKEQRSGQPV